MKTFTLAQAINVLNENFKGYKILKKWDNVRELCIVFLDGNGKKWELFSSGDNYFQTAEDFVIYEA
ncbi:hypothetical protein [Caecibacteroides pullorum]|uniref:Uncharacterized protein n=1 Tax=Caecibacteroides pullorum TaxID=2725562 RepID=A0AA41D9R5_9BACT|nr:hypothetical protein [Caecibacteroides pullorum]MBM6856622.1 hypothetical protein [Caecibacteroides pullorum]MBV8057628.1 hypothetical protein [Caecibacteroides pullorum]